MEKTIKILTIIAIVFCISILVSKARIYRAFSTALFTPKMAAANENKTVEPEK